jgi:hypothetical protein
MELKNETRKLELLQRKPGIIVCRIFRVETKNSTL